MSTVAGIDLGGTEIKALAFAPDGRRLAEARARTRDGEQIGGLPAFVHGVRSCLERLETQTGPLSGVGLCAPGLANSSESAIAFMPGRMAGLENLIWANALNRTPVRVLNDVHAALLGEAWLGAARGCRNCFMLTLGTGVGGAIIANGQLLRGHIGRAGHLGHVSLSPSGRPGITGLPGTLELTLSETALEARALNRWPSVRALTSAAERGKVDAQRFLHRAIDNLARGIASLINAIDPERIVIGGGIAEAGDTLFRPLRDALAKWEWRPGGHAVDLVPAQLGSYAGATGAAHRILQERSPNHAISR